MTYSLRDQRNRQLPNRSFSTGKPLELMERDLLIMEELSTHGPLPTSYIVNLLSPYGVAETKIKDRLTLLAREENTPHNGKYLLKRPEQFIPIYKAGSTEPTLYARRNQQLVYDLTPTGEIALADRFHEIDHGGWYEHQLMTACITASIEIACDLKGYKFIPQDAITAELEISVPYTNPETKKRVEDPKFCRLRPDALFGIEYPAGKRRYFALEADRDTESNQSKNYRKKTFRRSIAQYKELIGMTQKDGRKLYEALYNIPTLMLLVVTLSPRVVANMKEIIQKDAQTQGNNYMLLKGIERFRQIKFNPPKPLPEIFTDPWDRAGRDPFIIA